MSDIFWGNFALRDCFDTRDFKILAFMITRLCDIKHTVSIVKISLDSNTVTGPTHFMRIVGVSFLNSVTYY